MKLTANINVKLAPHEKRVFEAFCGSILSKPSIVCRQLIKALLDAEARAMNEPVSIKMPFELVCTPRDHVSPEGLRTHAKGEVKQQIHRRVGFNSKAKTLTTNGRNSITMSSP